MKYKNINNKDDNNRNDNNNKITIIIRILRKY